jgi:hypothetical protein
MTWIKDRLNKRQKRQKKMDFEYRGMEYLREEKQ